METAIFWIYFKPYFIGLIFGFIYLILFVDYESVICKFSKSLSLFIFFIVVFLSLFSYSLLLNSLYGASMLASLSTNWIAAIIMSIICFISALYSFGFLKLNKVRLRNGLFSSYPAFRAFYSLFINYQFFWICLNSTLLSLFVYDSPISILSSFLGIFTSFLFMFFVRYIPYYQ